MHRALYKLEKDICIQQGVHVRVVGGEAVLGERNKQAKKPVAKPFVLEAEDDPNNTISSRMREDLREQSFVKGTS